MPEHDFPSLALLSSSESVEISKLASKIKAIDGHPYVNAVNVGNTVNNKPFFNGTAPVQQTLATSSAATPLREGLTSSLALIILCRGNGIDKQRADLCLQEPPNSS